MPLPHSVRVEVGGRGLLYGTIDVFFVENTSEGKVRIYHYAPEEPGRWLYTEHDPDMDAHPNPTFSVPVGLAPKLIQALKDHGVSEPDAGMHRGRLKEMEKHLTDMRRIVFGPMIAGDLFEKSEIFPETKK